MVTKHEKPADNDAYGDWLNRHPAGYVMNKTLPADDPFAFTLHRADCRTISGTPPNGQSWIGISKKYCATTLPELEDYAASRWGATPGKCQVCL